MSRYRLNGRFLIDTLTKSVYSPDKGMFIQAQMFMNAGIGAIHLSDGEASRLMQLGQLDEPLDFIPKDERPA
jgi:hypothetical protein